MKKSVSTTPHARAQKDLVSVFKQGKFETSADSLFLGKFHELTHRKFFATDLEGSAGRPEKNSLLVVRGGNGKFKNNVGTFYIRSEYSIITGT